MTFNPNEYVYGQSLPNPDFKVVTVLLINPSAESPSPQVTPAPWPAPYPSGRRTYARRHDRNPDHNEGCIHRCCYLHLETPPSSRRG
jgi:hypothetical protein